MALRDASVYDSSAMYLWFIMYVVSLILFVIIASLEKKFLHPNDPEPPIDIGDKFEISDKAHKSKDENIRKKPVSDHKSLEIIKNALKKVKEHLNSRQFLGITFLNVQVKKDKIVDYESKLERLVQNNKQKSQSLSDLLKSKPGRSLMNWLWIKRYSPNKSLREYPVHDAFGEIPKENWSRSFKIFTHEIESQALQKEFKVFKFSEIIPVCPELYESKEDAPQNQTTL